MRITTSEYGAPVNAFPGWYIEVRGTYGEVLSPEALEAAATEARRHGWFGEVDCSAAPVLLSSPGDETHAAYYWFTHRGASSSVCRREHVVCGGGRS